MWFKKKLISLFAVFYGILNLVHGQTPHHSVPNDTVNARMENLKPVAMADNALSSLRNRLLQRMMAENNAKPNNFQQLQLQRMQQELRIQKLQRELEERKQQQAQLQQLLSLQNAQQGGASPVDPLPLSLAEASAPSPSLSDFASHGTPSLKALPVDAMMQRLRSRMDGSAGAGSGMSLFPELGLGLNTPLDASSLQGIDPSLTKGLDLFPKMAPEPQKPTQPNKHTINITVKRKTKVDVPGLPAALQNLNKPKVANKPAPNNPAGISPELLRMLDALRSGNAAAAAAAQQPPAAATATKPAAPAAPAAPNKMTIGALTGAPSVQQMANPMANMIQAAQAVHNHQTQGAVSGNMLATAVTASKASNTMADIVDTQMDAMADMAEAGMGFGMMNMMSMGGMNLMGGGMNMGGMSPMAGLGPMGGMGAMGVGGMGMNRMMSSTFMSPLGMF